MQFNDDVFIVGSSIEVNSQHGSSRERQKLEVTLARVDKHVGSSTYGHSDEVKLEDELKLNLEVFEEGVEAR